MKYTDIVKHKTVHMVSVSAKFATFHITHENKIYQFDVPLDDIGTGTLKVHDNAMYFARWIRKAIEDKTFVLLGENPDLENA